MRGEHRLYRFIFGQLILFWQIPQSEAGRGEWMDDDGMWHTFELLLSDLGVASCSVQVVTNTTGGGEAEEERCA